MLHCNILSVKLECFKAKGDLVDGVSQGSICSGMDFCHFTGRFAMPLEAIIPLN